MDGGILVFADLSSGGLDDAAKGILAEGRRLAALLGLPWGAACFDGAPDEAFDGFHPYGVPQVLELSVEVPGGADVADFPDTFRMAQDLLNRLIRFLINGIIKGQQDKLRRFFLFQFTGGKRARTNAGRGRAGRDHIVR